MKAHRLVVHRNGRLLGHFDADVPWAKEAIEELSQRLPESEGFSLEHLVAEDEHRLVLSGPDGVRILGRDPIFKRLP